MNQKLTTFHGTRKTITGDTRDRHGLYSEQIQFSPYLDAVFLSDTFQYHPPMHDKVFQVVATVADQGNILYVTSSNEKIQK
jgi:hypothetical protein